MPKIVGSGGTGPLEVQKKAPEKAPAKAKAAPAVSRKTPARPAPKGVAATQKGGAAKAAEAITLKGPESGVLANLRKADPKPEPKPEPKPRGCGCMGMPQDPKTAMLDAVSGTAAKIKGAKGLAAGCGCMGMPQDPKGAVLDAARDVINPAKLKNLAAGCGCMGMAQDPKEGLKINPADRINPADKFRL